MKPAIRHVKTPMQKLKQLAVSSALLLTVIPVLAQDNDKPVTIIDPKDTNTPVDEAKIEQHTFEIGLTLGQLSVEDFSTNSLSGLQATYHITPEYSVQLLSLQSDINRATFEDVVGSSFLADDDRKFNVTSLLFGYRLFHGRSFFSDQTKFNSRIVGLVGIGSTEFAGSDDTGLMLGLQYKTILNQRFTMDLNFRNHFFNRDFIGDDKRTQNLEFSVGLNVMF